MLHVQSPSAISIIILCLLLFCSNLSLLPSTSPPDPCLSERLKIRAVPGRQVCIFEGMVGVSLFGMCVVRVLSNRLPLLHTGKDKRKNKNG